MKEVFRVDGMMCPHCEQRVKKAVEAAEGVLEAVCSHEDGTVSVTGEFDLSVVKKAIEDAGYEVK